MSGNLMSGNLMSGNLMSGIEGGVIGPIDGNSGTANLGNPKLNPGQITPSPHKIPNNKAKSPNNPQRIQQHGEQQLFFTVGSYSGAKFL